METTLINDFNKLHREKIEEFWNEFGGNKNDGKGFDPTRKLRFLCEWSSIVIPRKQQQILEDRRAKFNRVKKKRHKLTAFSICFVCGGKPRCRHHIIQLQNGGINSKRNLVSLCDSCHSDIHPWLK